jgi:hypothetical protein
MRRDPLYVVKANFTSQHFVDCVLELAPSIRFQIMGVCINQPSIWSVRWVSGSLFEIQFIGEL